MAAGKHTSNITSKKLVQRFNLPQRPVVQSVQFFDKYIKVRKVVLRLCLGTKLVRVCCFTPLLVLCADKAGHMPSLPRITGNSILLTSCFVKSHPPPLYSLCTNLCSLWLIYPKNHQNHPFPTQNTHFQPIIRNLQPIIRLCPSFIRLCPSIIRLCLSIIRLCLSIIR